MQSVVFDSTWFAKHQRVLLGLLNAPVIGRELRDALAIRRCDVGYDGRIVALYPHAYAVANVDGTFTADVRTHAKYAKRLRYQFDAVWQAAHAWDRYVANPIVPALNLGFDTLTKYSDASPEVSSVDGSAARNGVNETWGTIRAGAGNTSDDVNTGQRIFWIKASATTSQWANLARFFTLFDTSMLKAGASIYAAVLSIWSTATNDGLGVAPDLDIYAATPASNTAIVDADFSQVGSTSLSTAALAIGSWVTNAYNPWSLSAAGIAAAISLTGISKIGFRNANYDVANVMPTWSSGLDSYVLVESAEALASTNDPKLELTWSGLRGWPHANLNGVGLSTVEQRWPA